VNAEPSRAADVQTDACHKRAFRGVHAAKMAHLHAGFRIRVYQCDTCGFYHVTNDEKRHRSWRDKD
jgi:hypothetical protein